MIAACKHFNRADCLISALDSATKDWIVEIIDPAQSGRGVTERVKFPYFSKRRALNYIARQKSFDHWNRYELVRES
jgi:hypothetical protein